MSSKRQSVLTLTEHNENNIVSSNVRAKLLLNTCHMHHIFYLSVLSFWESSSKKQRFAFHYSRGHGFCFPTPFLCDTLPLLMRSPRNTYRNGETCNLSHDYTSRWYWSTGLQNQGQANQL